MFFKRKRLKKQEALFVEALAESGRRVDPSKVGIDHAAGECFYDGERFSIVFPLRFLRESRRLSLDKVFDFSFRGLATEKRAWVRSYESARSSIQFTDKGRKLPKDFYDVSYYQELANSKFTLCPSGDFVWTYRFLEAIMCRSIPVIEPNSDHPHFEGFRYFLTSDSPADLLRNWDESVVAHNYNLFLRRNTLIEEFIFLPD